jgi:hypothetical protein
VQSLYEKDNETRDSLEVLLAWTAQQDTCYQEEILAHVKRLSSDSKDEKDVSKAACLAYQKATADLNRVCSPASNDTKKQNAM